MSLVCRVVKQHLKKHSNHGMPLQVHEAPTGQSDEARAGGDDARDGAGQRGVCARVPSSGPHKVDSPILPIQAWLVEGI